MEEILASIRQIISEDGDQPAEPHIDPNAKTGETESKRKEGPSLRADDLADPAEPETISADAHGDSMKPQPAETPAKLAPQPTHAASPAEIRSDSTGQRHARPAPQARPARPDADHHLLSAQADASVTSSFSALAHTILAQNARTLEDLVTEMLQPMLRGWLDDNLPSLVERLVKEEIDRVSRGRR
jgi:cell pole-organizing protein PopZ